MKTILCFSLILLCMQACSFRRFLYNHLDWLLLKQFDSYLDLDSQQKEKLSVSLGKTIAWVKVHKVPELRQLLQDVRKETEKPAWSEEALNRWFQKLIQWRVELSRELAPSLAELMQSMKPEQWAHLEAELSKNDKEWLEQQAMSESEWQKANLKSLEKEAKSFEFWLQELSPEQKEDLKASRKRDRKSFDKQFVSRKAQRAFVLGELRQLSISQRQEFLQSWASASGVSRDPEYLLERDKRAADYRQFLLRLSASLSQAQKQFFTQRLLEIEGDLIRFQGD